MQALTELQGIFGILGGHTLPDKIKGRSEAAVQAALRLEAPRHNAYLFRNNVGALEDERGVPVRYGLANDSKEINKKLKSGDLIGWQSILIGPQHVGHCIAQFMSIECKPHDWQYTGDAHEEAQLNWAMLVTSGGGNAQFGTGVNIF
jgi:hypothetical protein